MIRRPPRSTLFPYTTALPIFRPTEHDEPVGFQARHPARQRVFAAAVCRDGPSSAAVHPEWFHHAIGMACITRAEVVGGDRKSTRLNSSHGYNSYTVFCLKKKN